MRCLIILVALRNYKLIIISKPPGLIKYLSKEEKLYQLYSSGKYTFYPALDGTLVSIYYNDGWVFSTSRLANITFDNDFTPLNKPIWDDILEILDDTIFAAFAIDEEKNRLRHILKAYAFSYAKRNMNDNNNAESVIVNTIFNDRVHYG